MVRSLRFWAHRATCRACVTDRLRVFHALAVDSAFDIPIHDEYRVEVFIMGWLVLLLPLLLAGLYLMIPSLVSGRTGRWLSAANVLLTALGILAAVAPLWSNWLMFKELSTQGYYGSRMLIEDHEFAVHREPLFDVTLVDRSRASVLRGERSSRGQGPPSPVTFPVSAL